MLDALRDSLRKQWSDRPVQREEGFLVLLARDSDRPQITDELIRSMCVIAD